MIKRLLEYWQPVRKHRVGNYDLKINSDHALPTYQRKFATYDRFLPFIAAELPSGSTVIDVGANIGDSIAAMASANAGLRFIAVEPAEQFIPLLRHNCDIMRSGSPSPDIVILQCFVSDKLTITGITARSGTGRAVISATSPDFPSHRNVSLSSVIEGANSAVSLIKCDTDGYDWSVLDSGMAKISEILPMLFFECEVGTNDEHGADYARVHDRLRRSGYEHFYVFDNFGGFVLETTDTAVLQHMLNYVAAQNRHSLHRTMHYIDILAVSEHDQRAARSAVSNYVAKHHFV